MITVSLLILQIAQTFAGPLIQPRIVGGQDATNTQFRYTASILYKTAEGTFFCAGTLIESKWVITAGQCVQNALSLDIHLGTTDRSGINGTQCATDKFILHPEFSSSPLRNDIALIKLTDPVTYPLYVMPIDKLADEEIAVGYETVVVGWGQKSDSDATFSSSLQWAYVTILSNDECKVTYGEQITDEKVCVRGADNEGTCTGDSGGPLIHYPKWYIHVLVGISSFISQNGCENSDPSGFTRIYPFRQWINSTITDNS